MYNWTKEVNEILDFAITEVSNILPSEWAEKNRYMTEDVSPIPGPFKFDNSPYTREIVDCLSPYNPAKQIAVMKAAQIGFSTAVIENGIGWIISEQPGNILFLVGHEDLIPDSVKKIDRMLQATGIKDRGLIKSTTQRVRNTKSGDTDKMKEFQNGYMKIGIANHKTLRNISMRYGFIDDFEGMKSDTAQAGSTLEMIRQRFAAYKKKMKLFLISTPEVKKTSNILPVFLQGDQRRWHIQCPCCDEWIVFYWEVQSEINENEKCGIVWELDENNELIPESVGYKCQKCEGFFDDSNKTEMISGGKWIPTSKPSQPGYVSYHINSLYAPVYMFSWLDSVYRWMEAHPLEGDRDEQKYKTFINLVLGECYEPDTEGLKANKIQENIRPYQIGIVPEKLSIDDGNGKIVLITCGIDMNGTQDDARIDYEIVAWSENESTYSLTHGSVGTFINFDNNRTDRVHWTYRHGVQNSVWTELKKILSQIFVTDTGRKMAIGFTCLDSGYMPEFAYKFVDSCNLNVVSVKGKEETKYISKYTDVSTFTQSKNKKNLFLIETNYTKDLLASRLKLSWKKGDGEVQPSGFINFPLPSDGKYLFTNFFSHFEAENKVFDEKTGKFIWKKKTPNAQNHLFDCRLYNDVAKDILIQKLFKDLKIYNGTWKDYVNHILGKK